MQSLRVVILTSILFTTIGGSAFAKPEKAVGKGQDTVDFNELQEMYQRKFPLQQYADRNQLLQEIITQLNHMLSRTDISTSQIHGLRFDDRHAIFEFEGQTYRALCIYYPSIMKQDMKTGEIYDEAGYGIEHIEPLTNQE